MKRGKVRFTKRQLELLAELVSNELEAIDDMDGDNKNVIHLLEDLQETIETTKEEIR